MIDLVIRKFKERPPTEGQVLLDLARMDGDSSSSVMVDAHGVRLTLWLIVFEPGEPRRIRDLKEQEVWCAPTAALANPARFEEYLRGWLTALAEVALDEERAERLMPHDLVFSDVWQLKRPCTAAEFRVAFLMKSRLGRFLRR